MLEETGELVSRTVTGPFVLAEPVELQTGIQEEKSEVPSTE